ncbi:hypothetical protein L1987_50457 [Smallanthus sonchifolius]|uniref:Uncharacterized protein n=1 Tax=Smallanthus sonchifolius TaxID=185202 RepID=A0ACB9EMK1_9ASTR|nr:hypothetical protein L1987_50457 [Smallanthus sonchifolius]
MGPISKQYFGRLLCRLSRLRSPPCSFMFDSLSTFSLTHNSPSSSYPPPPPPPPPQTSKIPHLSLNLSLSTFKSHYFFFLFLHQTSVSSCFRKTQK